MASDRRQKTAHRPLQVECLEDRVVPATYAPNTFGDAPLNPNDGTLTLREAVLLANANPGGDTIDLAEGTYRLTLTSAGDLDLSDALTITGAGAGKTVVDATGLGDRVFHVQAHSEVSLHGLTITGGAADFGGGVLNEGVLKGLDLVITGNDASVAGGAYFSRDTYPAGTQAKPLFVELRNTDLSGNTVAGSDSADALNAIDALIADNAGGITDAVDEVFGKITTGLRAGIEGLTLPVVGDRIRDGLQPLFDSIDRLRTDARDFLENVLALADEPGRPSLSRLVSSSLYLVLGPGEDGLAQLDPDVRSALGPLAPQIARLGLGLLQDGPDAGLDVNPSDLGTVFGQDSQGKRWAEFSLVLGQRLYIDVPAFDLSLKVGGTELKDLLPNFGFAVESTTGIRFDLRWNLRLGLGVSEVNGGEAYVNAGATRTGLPDGPGVEELRLSLDVFAAPTADIGQTARQLYDDTVTTPNLRGEVSLGLMDAVVTDGTVAVANVVAINGVPKLAGDYSTSFTVRTVATDPHDGRPVDRTVTVNYHTPGGYETLPQFLVNINAALADAYGETLLTTPLSFTLDFGRVNRFYGKDADAPTTPSLVLQTRAAANYSLVEIHGAEELGFLATQYENFRSTTLGFGNNFVSEPDPATGGQRLVADLEAPFDGRLQDDVEFTILIGGQRVTADGVTFTQGATAVNVVIRELLMRDVRSREELRQRVQAELDAVSGGLVRIELEGDRFVLTSRPGAGGEPAPLLTTVYPPVDQTKLSLIAAVDVKDPHFNETALAANPYDQRFFNRLSVSEIDSAGASEVFVPTLKGDAEVRLHVATGADTLTDFVAAQVGLAPGSIQLPKVEFDLKIDAAFDALAGSDGQDNDGDGQEDEEDEAEHFSVSKFQFDRITLDVEQFLQTTVIPIAEALAEALEPILSTVGAAADAASDILNARLPVISDILDEDITLKSILLGDGKTGSLDNFLADVSQLQTLGDTISDYVRNRLSEVAEDGRWTFGGLELVFDKDSPLYFPRTKTPVPIELAHAFDSASQVGIDDFMHAFTAFDIASGWFSVDLFRPQTMFNLLTGEPFNIVSFGLPRVNIDAEGSFGFGWEDLAFDVGASVDVDVNFRAVYDSTGLQHIVDAVRAGTTPDWQDLLDGLYISSTGEDPDGDGYDNVVYMAADFHGKGEVDISELGVPVFYGKGEIDGGGSLALGLYDPNGDGHLRLDEILALTDNFASPERLFCLFKDNASGHISAGGEASIAGLPKVGADMGLVGGDFSLSDYLADEFGLNCSFEAQPELATVVTENGVQVLRVNVGPFASARLHGDTDDTDATAGVTATVTQSGDVFTVFLRDPRSANADLRSGLTRSYTGAVRARGHRRHGVQRHPQRRGRERGDGDHRRRRR